MESPAGAGLCCNRLPGAAPPESGVLEEWHYTIPELRWKQFAAVPVTGDTRTVARYLALCASGTGHAVLRNPVCISTPLPARRQQFCCNFFGLLLPLRDEPLSSINNSP